VSRNTFYSVLLQITTKMYTNLKILCSEIRHVQQLNSELSSDCKYRK